MLSALEMAHAGALLQAGMGYTSYAPIAKGLAEVAERLVD